MLNLAGLRTLKLQLEKKWAGKSLGEQGEVCGLSSAIGPEISGRATAPLRQLLATASMHRLRSYCRARIVN